jgi:hypothetical protein
MECRCQLNFVEFTAFAVPQKCGNTQMKQAQLTFLAFVISIAISCCAPLSPYDQVSQLSCYPLIAPYQCGNADNAALEAAEAANLAVLPMHSPRLLPPTPCRSSVRRGHRCSRLTKRSSNDDPRYVRSARALKNRRNARQRALWAARMARVRAGRATPHDLQILARMRDYQRAYQGAARTSERERLARGELGAADFERLAQRRARAAAHKRDAYRVLKAHVAAGTATPDEARRFAALRRAQREYLRRRAAAFAARSAAGALTDADRVELERRRSSAVRDKAREQMRRLRADRRQRKRLGELTAAERAAEERQKARNRQSAREYMRRQREERRARKAAGQQTEEDRAREEKQREANRRSQARKREGQRLAAAGQKRGTKERSGESGGEDRDASSAPNVAKLGSGTEANGRVRGGPNSGTDEHTHDTYDSQSNRHAEKSVDGNNETLIDDAASRIPDSDRNKLGNEGDTNSFFHNGRRRLRDMISGKSMLKFAVPALKSVGLAPSPVPWGPRGIRPVPRPLLIP